MRSLKLNAIPWRKIICYLLLFLIVPSVQVTLSGYFTFSGQTVDMTLVLAVLIGFLYGFKEGVISGLILGLIRDCLSAPVLSGSDGAVRISFGIGILLLFLAGVYGALFFEGRTNRNLLLGVLAVFTFTVIYKTVGHLAVFFWNLIFSSYKVPFDIADVLVHSVLPALLLNSVFAVPMYLILKYLGPVKYESRKKSGNKELTYGDSGKWLTI